MPRGAACSIFEAPVFEIAGQPDEYPISPTSDEDPLDAYSRAVSAVVERVGPAVVRVECVGEGRRRGGIGSGVIIAGDGLVLARIHRPTFERQESSHARF